jgi:hypothetical protein
MRLPMRSAASSIRSRAAGERRARRPRRAIVMLEGAPEEGAKTYDE